ncbi:V-type ATP synthase subunit E family protein [Phytohabitans kaempferiae]|uniref:V-type ATP synthase subunit E family protein n=1 Tax=Phytohabitans kaempferiae TaxID=1620943 RepID=A0ABV6M7Q1_9ACTN
MNRLDPVLAPVRAALLARAREEADQIRERSEVDARDAVTAATMEADHIRQHAHAEGEAHAATAVAAARSQAREQARALVLGARREAYERLRDAARRAVARMGAEPEFAPIRQRMVAAVRATLGPDAQITDVPDGGVAGAADGRRLDLSLTGFADRAVQAVAGREAETGPPATADRRTPREERP